MINYKILSNNENYACFKIKNEHNSFTGLSITLGNTFRRILLNNLVGSAITSLKINTPISDQNNVPGIKEDIFEISSNIKKLNIKSLDLKQRSEEHTSELQSRPHLVC